jgi:hypothetical protein
MTTDKIAQNMEVIGADGVHVGTVDGVTDGRIRLAKRDSGEGQHKGHAHFIDLGLVADVEGQRVRLSANAAAAVTFEEEQSGKPVSRKARRPWSRARHKKARTGDKKAASRRMPHARAWADERERP